MRQKLRAVIFGLCACAALVFPDSAQGQSGHPPRADFDHNGCGDLAVGIPAKDLGAGAVVNGGVVFVLNGNPSPQGIDDSGGTTWYQGGGLLEDIPEDDDRFGSPLAAGDFDKDGYVDLVIGVPHETIGNAYRGGAVNVVYGTPGGLAPARNQFWHQGSPGIDGAVEARDEFGYSLAIGDFNGDGYADVAIGVPNEDLEGVADDAGAVNVMYGSATGLAATGNQLWTQDSTGISDEAELGDYFGVTLAAGDFDGDGETDLAIGVPQEDIEALGLSGAGLVHVLYGGSSGLTSIGNGLFGIADIPGSGGPADVDAFGSALVAGDFDGNGYDDLAVGISHREAGGFSSAGAVAVFYGAPVGLTELGSEIWDKESSGIQGPARDHDYLGETLASGDFDGDGYDDLALGVGLGNSATVTDAGYLQVLYGSPSGVSDRDLLRYQGDDGLADSPEPGDRFGATLAAGDFDCDGFVDLAVASITEDLGGVEDAGSVHVLYGSSGGLLSAGSEFWHQGIIDGLTPHEGDEFGRALASAFSPHLFVDGFEFDTTQGWSVTLP